MQIHWIWLAHRPGVSDRIKGLLWRRFQDAEEIYYAPQEAFREIDGMTKEAAASLADKSLAQAGRIQEECQRQGIGILTVQDTDYPCKLKNITEPPLVLYYKGRLPEMEDCPVIGVVGTRKASAYGLKIAGRMGYQIAGGGAIVVSGMAGGIDTMAMQGALMAGKTTVGVLGCGVDIVYPRSNRKLFEEVEQYGCILSEFAPGTPAARWTFPRRNRIISGLSDGVLVVEAPEKSGALITAGLALEQGRDVFAVPGNIDQPGFVGSNRLLREGAGAVSCGWDILCEYTARYPDKVHQETAAGELPGFSATLSGAQEKKKETCSEETKKPKQAPQKPGVHKKLDKKPIDNSASGTYSDVNDLLSRLNREEQAVVMMLQSGQRLVDDVIAGTGLSTGKLLAVLTVLELKGVIRRLPGKRIALK